MAAALAIAGCVTQGGAHRELRETQDSAQLQRFAVQLSEMETRVSGAIASSEAKAETTAKQHEAQIVALELQLSQMRSETTQRLTELQIEIGRLRSRLKPDGIGETKGILERHERMLARIEERLTEMQVQLARCQTLCKPPTCEDKPPPPPGAPKGDPPHFYEIAFVGFGALDGICFAILGLLFTVYIQFMQSLNVQMNPLPPLATRSIVLSSRLLAGVIWVSGIAAVASLWVLVTPRGPLEILLGLALMVVLGCLDYVAYKLVASMRLPKK